MKEHGEETSMREYQTGMREERVLSKVVCNGCGREIPLRGDYFRCEKHGDIFPSRMAGRMP
ncbi:MAG: hypothetical protein ACLUD9_04345 [Anaerotignum faecicola]